MLSFKNYKSRIYLSIILLLPFLVIYALSRTILNDVYLFEWTARHLYCYIWLIVIVLIFAKKTSYAVTLSIANIAGILIGHFLGTWMMIRNMKTITSNMDPQTVYELRGNDGVFIWLGVILFLMIVCFIVNKVKLKMEN